MEEWVAVLLAALIQVTGVALAASVAYFAVIKQIKAGRATATRQLTYQTILQCEAQGSLWTNLAKDADSVFRNDALWESLIDQKANRELLARTLSFLNYFELIAIGIEQHTLDEALYSDWFRSGYIENWHVAKAFVERWRTSAGEKRLPAFVKLQALAERWEREGVRNSSR